MTVAAVACDYSQHGEQEAILEWANALAQPGSFVDLGAHDGARYSNTAALADRSWPGICVDAAPDAAGACAQRYADRPDVLVVLAAFAAGECAATATVYWTPGEMYSATSASRRSDVTLVPLEVPRLDLGWFAERISEMPRPVFCSIDLEGASLDALQWLLAHVELGCVCVEANTSADRSTVRSWLSDWREMPLAANPYNLLFTSDVWR